MKQYNNYADLITYTRASSGTALRPISYGDELVSNGTFDSDVSGWETRQPYGTISVVSSECFIDNGPTGGFSGPSQAVTVVSGKIYLLSAKVRKGANADRMLLTVGPVKGSDAWGITETSLSDDRQLSLVFVAQGSTANVSVAVGNNSEDEGYCDNISVREVLFDQPDGTLTLFNHPTNILRIEYDSDGNRLGLLVEEARTNLVTQSEDFSVANLTVEDAGEFMGMSRKLFTKTTTGAIAYVQNFTASAGNYTITLVMERGTSEFTSFGLLAGGWLGLARLDWDSMTITLGAGTLESSSVEVLGTGPSGNPVARATVTINVPSAGTVQFLNYFFNSTTTDADLTVYFYHQQLEAGSFPTSYIPSNSGSTTTRSADVASIGVSEFGFNSSEGTLFVDVNKVSADVYVNVFGGGNATTQSLFCSETRVFSGDNPYSFYDLDTTSGFKAAYHFGADSALVVVNGNIGTAAAAQDSISNTTTWKVGGTWSTTNGAIRIKSIKYYPRRLTNAQLQELTS